MSALAPTLQAFFTDRLINQRDASPHTIAAYRDTFRLLLAFTQQTTGKRPTALDVEHLDASRITAFLDHLERDRNNSPRTLNARLAVIHSLFRFAALRHPEHADLIARVLAVPAKRFDRAIVSYLTPAEVDALLAAPDRTRWIGRRDHALITVAIQTGLRVSELTALRCQDVHRSADRGRSPVHPDGLGLVLRLRSLPRERSRRRQRSLAPHLSAHVGSPHPDEWALDELAVPKPPGIRRYLRESWSAPSSSFPLRLPGVSASFTPCA
jgi:integrase